MNHLYLDVAVVRIGEYLARTPELSQLRGASALLSEACRSDDLLEASGGQWVSELGKADGVANLKLPADADPADTAERVIATLRRKLPAAEFEAFWAKGTDYFDAFFGKGAPPSHKSGYRPLAELPFAARCQVSGSDMAVDTVYSHDTKSETRRASADAVMRQKFAERNIGPDGALRTQFNLEAPKDFDDLAAQYTLNDFKANHLALVSVDGDNIGALMKDIDAGQRAAVSRGLKSATAEALNQAVEQVCLAINPCKLPVIPHIVGGDDVLVSLPAPVVWIFVRNYLDRFTSEVWDSTRHEVTASAGVVIANVSFPFREARRLADDLQGEAKKLVGTPSVAWLDVTRNGVAVDDAGPPVPTRFLSEHEELIGQLAEMEKSTRFAAFDAVEDLDEEAALLAKAKLLRLARRHDSKVLAQLAQFKPVTVRTLLSVSQWWWT